METIIIQVPDDCEVQIVRKEEKKEPVIRTYQDLIDNEVIHPMGFYIDSLDTRTKIVKIENEPIMSNSKDVAASEKVAKSMLAMAMISQLIPYYGGEVTDEEWKDYNIYKYCLMRKGKYLTITLSKFFYHFLAFHTEEQRDEFLKYNKQLVKDYLMID